MNSAHPPMPPTQKTHAVRAPFLFGIALMVLLLGLSSCKTLRPSSTDEGNLKERSSRFLLKQLAQQQLSAEWFSAKARITYQDPYETVKFTTYIRMRKDSLIWMNFKKLSVEAARVLITPDSFFVIDRLNNQYAEKDLEYLQDQFYLPINFDLLQNMLLGNPFFLTSELDASIEGRQYKLEGASREWKSTYGIDGWSFALRQLLLQDVIRGRSLSLEQDDFQEVEPDKKFSYLRNLTLQDQTEGALALEIEFSNVELNVPKNIHFEIPKRYTKID